MAATYPPLALPEVCPQLMLAAMQTTATLAEAQPQAPVLSPIAEIVREGLLRMPKQLPPWLFYDEAGSLLFDRITELGACAVGLHVTDRTCVDTSCRESLANH